VREHHRIVAELSVFVELEGADAVPGLARDLSLGGAFIESSLVPPFGTIVTLRLTGPELRFPGVVRWTSERGFGLQFGLLGARETHGLVKLLAELRQAPASDGNRASGF
jgi:hypothetical protein